MKTRIVAVLVATVVMTAALTRAANAEPADGSWALGWQGLGTEFPNATPSARYVWNEKTSLELIPMISLEHYNFSNDIEDIQSYGLYFDVRRKIASSHGVDFSYLIEPSYRYSFEKYAYPGYYNKSYFSTFGLGAGVDVEYFVLPNLSLGARAVLTAAFAQGGQFVTGSPSSVQITKNLSWQGQLLNVHYYFGGGSAAN